MAQIPNLFSDDELKRILDEDLLVLMGAKNMTDEEKVDLYVKMAETVQDRAMLRIYDNLTVEERQAFAELVDAKDEKKTNEYLLSKGINVPQLLIQEAMIYKVDMMSLFKVSQINAATAVKE